MQLKNSEFEDLNDNFTKITSTSYSLIQYGKKYYHLNIFLFIEGEFIYSSFSVNGPFSKRMNIAIYIDIFKNIDITNIIPNNKNEKIENNNTYYLFIPTSIASSCYEGEYYDPSK